MEGLHVAMEDAVAHSLFRVSGLCINLASNLYGIGVGQHEVDQMAGLTECVEGSVPFRYLGLPVGNDMRSIVNWHEVTQRSLGGEQERKIAWVKWDVVLNSKDNGGFGIGSLKAFNQALLYKWRWRFINNPDAIWVKAIQSIHGRDG
ncbi:hypothetical protein Tco_1239441, partial [Tanacetum coccineum]